MSEIDALQQRLTAAMDRIATGVDALEPAGGVDVAALQSALDEEKVANEQLRERVRKMAEREDAMSAQAKDATEATQARFAALDLELQKLGMANDQLRQSNAALRAANGEGVGDAHLINASMQAELDALRAARAAEVAEATSILDALTPLLSQVDVQGEEDGHA